MNIHAPLDSPRYARRLWWVMLAGCAARFTAERSAAEALAGFLFWACVFAGCWVLRGIVRRGGDAAARAEKAGNVVAVGGLLLFLLKINSDGLIPALLVFLFAIQAAAFVSAEKRLHAWLIVGAAFAGLLFAAAESRSGMFLICATWFTFAALGLLTFDQSRDQECKALLLPRDADNRSGGALVFGTIVLAITLPVYLFVPKPAGWLIGGMQAKTAHDYRDYPNTDRRPPPIDARTAGIDPNTDTSGDDGGAMASLAEQAPATATPESGAYGESFSSSNVQRDRGNANAIVMYVKSSHDVYLRGKIYDYFENDRWSRREGAARTHRLERGWLDLRSGKQTDTMVRQTIEVVAQLDRVLIHSPGLERLRFPGPRVRSYPDGVFEAPHPLLPDTTYSVESTIDLWRGRYLLRDPQPADMQPYLQLAADATDRVRSLASRIAGEGEDAFEKALLLERHLRTQYEYSYETIPLQGYTPIDSFLFETKRGHCEYFASALAVMLRTQGIAARVATGFSLGEPNPITGFYEVRALDGHAWVEAYIPGEGWLMLEPTPFYPLPDASPEELKQVADETERYLDRLAETQQTLAPESLKTALIVLARDTWTRTRHVLRQIASVPRELGWTAVYLVAGAAALAVAGYFALLLIMDARTNRRVREQLSRSQHADEPAAALMLADALERAATPRGYLRKPHWTFREYSTHLADTPSAIPLAFAEDFDRSRYSEGERIENSAAFADVRTTIETLIARDPWPRARRTLEAWRQAIKFREPTTASRDVPATSTD